MRADGGRNRRAWKLRRMQIRQEIADKSVEQYEVSTKVWSVAPIPLRSLVIHGIVQLITIKMSRTAAVLLPGRS